jgi:hypothetical protein
MSAFPGYCSVRYRLAKNNLPTWPDSRLPVNKKPERGQAHVGLKPITDAHEALANPLATAATSGLEVTAAPPPGP